MIRNLFIALWVAAPLGVGAYHFGPGQERLRTDEAGGFVAEAEAQLALAAEPDASELARSAAYARAKKALERALELVPDDATHLRRDLLIEHAKCRMFTSELPRANGELAQLVSELAGDADADPAQLARARDAFANSQYYLTWLMRLEGAGRADWEPHVESARQTYRLLAEDAEARGDATAATRHTEDLEAAIRLARMELTELQGLPLPSQ